MTRNVDAPRYARWTWGIAALLLLVLALMWIAGYGPRADCCGAADVATTSVPISPALAPPPPMQSAAKAPGGFAVRLEGEQRVIEGKLADTALKTRVLQAASAAYGETNVVDKIAIEADVAASKCAEKADTLFDALKTDPPIGIVCDTHGTVTLTGTAASDADKASREAWAHEFFGADTTIVDRIEVAVPQPVSRPEDVRCAARMPAAVTFKTASSRIDAKGRALLDAIAPCLKTGRYEIAGHTDSIGAAADNMKLSQARAESVRAYMILKGIDADRLVAIGYGADHPIGDNATPAGRANNRRIEFARK